jgi:cyanate permease
LRQYARFVAALFLVSLALRPQIIATAPLIPSIQADLGISHAVAGLLSAIPVLCMGVFAPAAAYVSGASCVWPFRTRGYSSRSRFPSESGSRCRAR